MPFIRHNFQIDEWQAVAQLLVWERKQAGRFPVQLAPPFLEEVPYGTVTSSCKDGFLQNVSDQERQVLLTVLENFDSVKIEALLQVLGVHERYQLPTEDNLVPLLSQLSHKC